MPYIGNQTKEDIVEQFERYVSSGKARFFSAFGMDFVFGKRKGPYVWDTTGSKRLINCHCNGGVFNLGHRHPQVVDALAKGLKELDIGNHHFISETRARLGEKMAALLPGDMQYTVFGVGGGEAIDLAIKLARGVTKKTKIISAKGGYHGHTGYALATGDATFRDPFGPNLEGFVQIRFNDRQALEQAVDKDTAGVIFEAIPATSGMPIPDLKFFSQAKKICQEKGALLIIDEVQTGLGRTGAFWGIEHFNTIPDILVTGKGLSGGIYPMSATCFGPELESFFHQDPFIHVSTFGGAELGCPVAMAVLDISSDSAFLENVNRMGELFRSGFETLKFKHPQILLGLRQKGLMMGIEMVNEDCGPVLSKTLFDNGILSIYANNDKRISQLLPPLIMDAGLAEEILDGVDKSLEAAKTFLSL